MENIRGHMLSCLMDSAENATEPECRSFLKKMEAIIFSDYRLIYKFTEECQSDIEKFQCGRLDMDSEVTVLELIKIISVQYFFMFRISFKYFKYLL